MARIILLDSGPLGLACSGPGLPAVSLCLDWFKQIEATGTIIMIPAIADYEIRRELIRVDATAKIRRLVGLYSRFEYLEISREALDRAADFWAKLRQSGKPTAGQDSIDGDSILAGMATNLGSSGTSVIVATSNLKHLSRFPGLDGQTWDSIA